MSTSTTDEPPVANLAPLTYATPVAPTRSPLVAATVVGVIGLGMIVLGGCFLIPLSAPLFVQQPEFKWSRVEWVIAILFLALAFGCFALAGWLLVISIGGLRRIMRG
jgi:hypothetical protein